MIRWRRRVRGGVQRVRHLRARSRLDAFADGELTGRSIGRVERHLVECDGCRREVDAIVALKAALSRLGATVERAPARLRSVIDRSER